jgi:hypothetical protein
MHQIIVGTSGASRFLICAFSLVTWKLAKISPWIASAMPSACSLAWPIFSALSE